jgi:choline/glycine/proline betaine transport protein
MEHENSSYFFDSSSILGPTIFIFNPSYKTLEITYLVLQVATWTESYTGSNWQNAGPSSIGMVDCLVSFVGMFIARISKGVLFVSLFWEFY